jgi:hypothetical protein
MATNNIHRNSYIKKHKTMYVNNNKVPSDFISSINLASSVNSNDILNYTGSNWNNEGLTIDKISDLEIINVGNGDVLKYDNGWANDYLSTDNVQDLDINTIQDKEYVIYNSSTSKWERSSITLEGLSDTNFTGMATNNTLKYSSGNYIKTDMKIIEDNNKTVLDSVEKSIIIGQLSTAYTNTSTSAIRISPDMPTTVSVNTNLVAIGNKCGYKAGTESDLVAIGSNAVNAGSAGVGIGKSAGGFINYFAGALGSGSVAYSGQCYTVGYSNLIPPSSVGLGNNIRIVNSSRNMCIIGHNACKDFGSTNTNYCTIIGYGARSNLSATNEAAGHTCIGSYALCNLSSNSTTAIGYYAGAYKSPVIGVAIGSNASMSNAGASNVTIGSSAGSNCQLLKSVAIGTECGREWQKEESVAIGYKAGSNNQGSNSVAIGYLAGTNLQGSNSIAIGYNCGSTCNNSIVFNASNVSHNLSTAGFFLTPNILTGEAVGYGVGRMFYDTVTGELKYSTT